MMDNLIPISCPSIESCQEDLESLVSEGIKIWSTSQEVLEEQALRELEIFVEESALKNNTSENNSNEKSTAQSNFDIVTQNIVETKENQLSYENKYEGSIENVDTSFVDSSRKEPKSFSTNYSDNESGEEISDGGNEESGSEYIPSDEDNSDHDYQLKPRQSVTNKKKTLEKPSKKKSVPGKPIKVTDDAVESNYKTRLDIYYKKLEEELSILGVQHDGKEYKKLKGGLKVPKDVWNKLYEYQKDGVFWLWELHQESTGGLLGDEMGLGKTVQVIVFLHGLQYTQYVSKHDKFIGLGPTIIVCPATVIHQWVKHFHEWAPEFRVVILHQSGSYHGNKNKLIDEINKSKGIIITTYAGILKYKGCLGGYNWHYLILDEGHKIRNPNAKVTLAVKEIRTPHRIMLTGSPMQNNLTELWSLFDFTNPGMLGSLAVFTEHFSNPILQGGFSNSSPMQEATALSVASALKNIISPYLLRRMKSEVQDHIQLPHKTEQVLFCSLTDEQRDLYKDYLMSEQVNSILGRGIKNWSSTNFMKANMLKAITALRKICNHPHLFLHEVGNFQGDDDAEQYGYYKRSGKMVVVSALLKIWKKQGHRTLLFCQGRGMIKIIEIFLEQQDYRYLKMDGTTSITSREGLINLFNSDVTYDVFILTTRVGGLGVNLTGADRIIIYDPDWNPATDAQAKERAWRIGQEKSVTVYRLLSAGTVEEKMYQRQVWKQLLSNKVLIDPTTNKFFKSSDLFDLFSLPESTEAKPETTNIFRDSRVKIQERIKENEKNKGKSKSKKKLKDTSNIETVEFSKDKIEAMKNLAQKIAKSLSQNNDNDSSKKIPIKNAYHLELEEERRKKLEEKEKLKKLTHQELLEYNRKKLTYTENDSVNKIDDKVSNVTFEEALEHSSKTAKLYHKLASGQIKYSEVKKLIPNTSENKERQDCIEEKQEKVESSKKRKHRDSIDSSGKINGEQIDGLLKCETRKLTKKVKTSQETNDNYILEHLFSKKGVSGALEHDSVLNGGKKQQSLKVRTCADERALKSLEALKKSRLNNWKY